MNNNIKTKFDHKNALINQHLKYLYDKGTSTMLKIQAIEFLYPYRNEDMIIEKLEFFYERERDQYIRQLLKKTLNGTLESFIITKFDSDEDTSNEGNMKFKSLSLTAKQIAMMKISPY